MERKRVTRLWMLLLIVMAVVVTACGGGTESPNVSNNDSPATSNQEAEVPAADEDEEDVADEGEEEAEAEALPENELPEALVVHPDAMNIEANPASNTYVYTVPMMVEETAQYLQTEFTERGWEPLGQPTIMGHLATLNLQQEGRRVTISMQDNERTETTRVQMVLMEQ